MVLEQKRMARCLTVFLIFFGLSVGVSQAAQASLHIEIDRSEQIMRVYVHNELYYVWPVSTGRRGYTTPTGSFRPYSLRKHHRSSKYYNAPIPIRSSIGAATPSMARTPCASSAVRHRMAASGCICPMPGSYSVWCGTSERAEHGLSSIDERPTDHCGGDAGRHNPPDALA